MAENIFAEARSFPQVVGDRVNLELAALSLLSD